MNIVQLLNQSFQEHTITWLILSALIGGIIGASIKFFFEFLLKARFQRRWDEQRAVKELSYPLLRAADSLERRINIFLKTSGKGWFEDQNDDYFRLSTLYQFGVYLGWAKVLEDRAYLEFSTSKRTRDFYIRFYTVLQGFTGHHYFNKLKDTSLEDKEKASVPRLALRAIGELMIAEEKSRPGGIEKIIDFSDFSRRMIKSEDYMKWFKYLERLLENLEESKSDLRWDRLAIIATNLRMFAIYLDPRGKQTKPRKITYLDQIKNQAVAKYLRSRIKKAGMAQYVENHHPIKDDSS